jgi:hypothetical protein
MILQEYLANNESKYAIIRTDSYLVDDIAQSISQSPRQFDKDGISFTLLSLDPAQIPTLAKYAETVGNGVEFQLTVGSGKVTLLTHKQVLDLLPNEINE